MSKLILVRHGQSTYNLENKFTGWKDVDLTDKGRNEALYAIKLLENIPINVAYTSNLKRAQDTLDIILDGLSIVYSEQNEHGPEIFKDEQNQ